jgi:hypothetical protein
MRKFILTLVVGIAALGWMAAAPSKAQAQYPRGNFYSYYPGTIRTFYGTSYYGMPTYGAHYVSPGYLNYSSYPGFTSYQYVRPSVQTYYSSPFYSTYSYTPAGSYSFYLPY